MLIICPAVWIYRISEKIMFDPATPKLQSWIPWSLDTKFGKFWLMVAKKSANGRMNFYSVFVIYVLCNVDHKISRGMLIFLLFALNTKIILKLTQNPQIRYIGKILELTLKPFTSNSRWQSKKFRG